MDFIIVRASYGNLPENKDLDIEKRDYQLGGRGPYGNLKDFVNIAHNNGIKEIAIVDPFAHPDETKKVVISDNGDYQIL